MSDMQPSELVITMIVSDIASIPMQNTSQPLLSGVIPVAILVALEITASIIMMKWSGFRSLVCGKPVIVIKDGRILQSAMKKLRLTTEDLSVRLRQQGIFSIEDVQYCIVETNGEVSVLEKPEKRKPSAEDFGLKIKDNKIETVVVATEKFLKIRLIYVKKKRVMLKIFCKRKILSKAMFF